MTQEVFYLITRDVFVMFEAVTTWKEDKPHFVVDSHTSRNASVNPLIEHDIDLGVLPSGSFHVVQPLDLGLFRWTWLGRESSNHVRARNSFI